MGVRYVYAERAAAGPERSTHRWGVMAKAKELTPEQAAEVYALDAVERERWFGIVRVPDGAERPDSLLQICPRANGVKLERLDEFGRIAVSYIWGAYDHGVGTEDREPDATQVFLGRITWYFYPEAEKRFLMMNLSERHVSMQFRRDGYAKQETVVKRGFGEPHEVELQELSGVDVSANWFDIPEFGDWEAFFDPEGDEGAV